MFMYLHRQLGFFFAGIVIVYAVSGIALNHRKSFNPAHSVEQKEFSIPAYLSLTPDALAPESLDRIVELAGCDGKYTKHYQSGNNIKILLKGGSSITVDASTRVARAEIWHERPVLSTFTKLHYNPGSWWTAFSDVFAVSLIIVTVTGLFIVRGRKGMWGVGGILFLLGCLVPVLFLMF